MQIVPRGHLNLISVEPTLRDQVILAQLNDDCIKVIKQKLAAGDEKYKCFRQDWQGGIWFGARLVVPKNADLRRQILDEAHCSKLSIHPGSNKMYQDLGKAFGGLE